jgi:two-component system cell cycle response regulator
LASPFCGRYSANARLRGVESQYERENRATCAWNNAIRPLISSGNTADPQFWYIHSVPLNYSNGSFANDRSVDGHPCRATAMNDETVYHVSPPAAVPKENRKEACLIMIDGDYLGEVYELNRDDTVIGRTDGVDIAVVDPGVSRQHAKITREIHGYFAVDMGSKNGTLVNNELISGPRELQDGDKIRVSQTSFKFSYQDADDNEYHRQLRERAVKDGLTGIYNKRYFMESIEKEFQFAERHGTTLCLIMFDIDYFKKFNDTFGHPTGDYILKNLARLVEAEARNYDTFARYGGEEFAILLRGSSLSTAVAFAERIRTIIEHAEFEYDEQTFSVTVSLGVATFGGGTMPDQHNGLIAEADKSLYEAKRNGRNRTYYSE